MVKEIKMNNTDKVILIDDENYDWLIKYKWYLDITGYARINIWISGKRTQKLIHQLIINSQKGEEIDHIDRNTLNNQKENLRVVNKAQNQMNSKSRNGSVSKFKGVGWHKRDKKWTAKICLNYKTRWLGYFNNEIDAAKAYNKAAKELFGEYANLNDV